MLHGFQVLKDSTVHEEGVRQRRVIPFKNEGRVCKRPHNCLGKLRLAPKCLLTEWRESQWRGRPQLRSKAEKRGTDA